MAQVPPGRAHARSPSTPTPRAVAPPPRPWRVPGDPAGWSRYVRGLQAHLGVNAHGFARRVRTSPNAVAAWRRGDRSPTGAQALRLATVAAAEGYAGEGGCAGATGGA